MVNDGDPGAFHTTQWTAVIAARGNSQEARVALGELCETYYTPVVAFLQREGRSEELARDLAHGFFEWLLTADRIAALERERGRFRSYLLGALKHYLSHERERAKRLKRGGDAVHEPIQPGTETSPGLDPADLLTLPPDREFDRQWALHILAEAMAALEREWKQAGKGLPFAQLKPFLAGDARKGALQAAARKLDMPEATLRSSLHRLRKAYRRQVRAQIAPTLQDADQLDEEMHSLLAALSDG